MQPPSQLQLVSNLTSAALVQSASALVDAGAGDSVSRAATVVSAGVLEDLAETMLHLIQEVGELMAPPQLFNKEGEKKQLL